MTAARGFLRRVISDDPLPFLLAEAGVALGSVLTIVDAYWSDGSSTVAFWIFFVCAFAAMQTRMSAATPPKTVSRSIAARVLAAETLIGGVVTLAAGLVAGAVTMLFYPSPDMKLLMYLSLFEVISVTGVSIGVAWMSWIYWSSR